MVHLRHANHEDGDWVGVIGKTMSKAKTRVDAFNSVVAKHLGYETVEQLNERNRQVAFQNRVRRDAIQSEMRQVLGEDFFRLLQKL